MAVKYEQPHVEPNDFPTGGTMGSGVPCTIQHLNGKLVPQIPEPPKRQAQFHAEIKDHFQKVEQSLASLEKKIEEAKLSEKAKNELRKDINSARANFGGNLKFVADQFGEHMEKVTEHAKIEIAAWAQAAIGRAGLRALGVTQGPLELPKPETT